MQLLMLIFEVLMHGGSKDKRINKMIPARNELAICGNFGIQVSDTSIDATPATKSAAIAEKKKTLCFAGRQPVSEVSSPSSIWQSLGESLLLLRVFPINQKFVINIVDHFCCCHRKDVCQQENKEELGLLADSQVQQSPAGVHMKFATFSTGNAENGYSRDDDKREGSDEVPAGGSEAAATLPALAVYAYSSFMDRAKEVNVLCVSLLHSACVLSHSVHIDKVINSFALSLFECCRPLRSWKNI